VSRTKAKCCIDAESMSSMQFCKGLVEIVRVILDVHDLRLSLGSCMLSDMLFDILLFRGPKILVFWSFVMK